MGSDPILFILRVGEALRAAWLQDNPLKAVAELVENSIDAEASSIAITRGCERGDLYLELLDRLIELSLYTEEHLR